MPAVAPAPVIETRTVTEPPTDAGRAGWVAAVSALVGEVAGWCEGRGWAVKRGAAAAEFEADATPLPRLLFHTGDRQYRLQASHRFDGASDGVVHLAVLPEYDVELVVGGPGGWTITVGRDVRADPARVPLTEAEFVAALDRLAVLADSIDF